jgi:hypothetical protein
MIRSSIYVGKYVKLFLLLVLLCFTSLSLHSCFKSISEKPYQEISLSSEAERIIQSKTGIKLPKSYHNLRAIQDSGLDWIIRFSFEMKQSEMSQFIIDTGFQEKLERNPIDRVVLDMNGYDWFTPSTAKNYLAGQYFSKQQNLAKKLLIDITNKEMVKVYMDVFSK